MESTLAVLKSNARIYNTPPVKPILVGINMSSSKKEAELTTLNLTKGDTVSLQLVNGPTDTSIVSDGSFIYVSKESSSTRRFSNSYIITVTSDSMTYLGLKDINTLKEYRLTISMNSTPLEGTISEIIP